MATFAQNAKVTRFALTSNVEMLPKIVHTNLTPELVAEWLSAGPRANYPLHRIALRSPDALLVASARQLGRLKFDDAWLRTCSKLMTDAAMLVVPVHRDGALIGVGFFVSVAENLDPLMRAMLSVLTHAALLRARSLNRSNEEPPRLTHRERDCLQRAAQGLTTAAIARRLGITERTARFHLDNARTRLGVPTKALAIRRAIGQGLIQG